MPPRKTQGPAAGRAASLAHVRALARESFGLAELRPEQEEAISAVLEGRDTLAVLPTGSGKSAIYQIAGLLLPGPTIVVSPLIAMQRDQVGSILGPDIAPAEVVDSLAPAPESQGTLAAAGERRVEFLLLVPEQLGDPERLARLQEARPSLFVVDEAHCISEWGHDFRPDYLKLGAVREALGAPVILALTATASPRVRDEIASRLRLREPRVVVGGFDRPNIRLEVDRFASEEEKDRALVEAVVGAPRPGIVYVATRQRAEDLAAALRRRGVSAVHYHAGLSRRQREESQEVFIAPDAGDGEVIVATSAFGMGIDKPNVRFVYHADAPESMDAYYQEIGRAGRDGAPASAVLFYRPQDLGLRRFFASSGRIEPAQVERVMQVLQDEDTAHPSTLQERTGLSRAKLTSAVTGLEDLGAVQRMATGEVKVKDAVADASRLAAEAAAERERRREGSQERVETMRGYAETSGCRRRFILGYFGEEAPEHCDNCDVCARRGSLAPRLAGKARFPDRSFVVHRDLGRGMVLRREGSHIVVLFDEAGEKRLSLAAVERGRLLEPTA